MEDPFELSKSVSALSLEDDCQLVDNNDIVSEFFAVKFCPYQPLDADPVFAAVSKKHVVICKLSRSSTTSETFNTIKLIRDDDPRASNCCCTWTHVSPDGPPYLCVAGADGVIKIYDVIHGRLFENLAGHGGGINDLATCPSDSAMIASASDDTTVRIWSLHAVHREQPCLCILAGEGHVEGVLSASFHDSGKFVISGGYDHRINLWTVPDLPSQPTESPLQVHFPHFSTSAVHGGIVDCVAFYGDQILSRANQDNIIILWQILGFSSQVPPPPMGPLPKISQPNDRTSSQFTRSAFTLASSQESQIQVYYDRRLQFHTPKCDEYFFLRFQLHFQPGQHPILTFCNTTGEILFWDLERIRAYDETMSMLIDRDRTHPLQLPTFLKRQNRTAAPKSRAASVVRSVRSIGQIPEVEERRPIQDFVDLNMKDVASWNSKYCMLHRDDALEAHHKVHLKNRAPLLGRQVAWSPDGKWCVAALSSNVVHVLRRWT